MIHNWDACRLSVVKVPLAKTLTDSSGNAAIDNDLAYYWWLFVCVVVYWHTFSGISPMEELC